MNKPLMLPYSIHEVLDKISSLFGYRLTSKDFVLRTFNKINNGVDVEDKLTSLSKFLSEKLTTSEENQRILELKNKTIQNKLEESYGKYDRMEKELEMYRRLYGSFSEDECVEELTPTKKKYVTPCGKEIQWKDSETVSLCDRPICSNRQKKDCDVYDINNDESAQMREDELEALRDEL